MRSVTRRGNDIKGSQAIIVKLMRMPSRRWLRRPSLFPCRWRFVDQGRPLADLKGSLIWASGAGVLAWPRRLGDLVMIFCRDITLLPNGP